MLVRCCLLPVLLLGLIGPVTASADVAAEFETLHGQWSEKEDRLRELQASYRTAPADRRREIVEEFNGLVAELEEMAPAIHAAAVEAYRADPNEDEDVNRFVLAALDRYLAEDKYPRAAEVADLMMDNEYPNEAVYDRAGAAAFALGDFDEAERYFQRAEDAGALSELGRRYAPLVEDYQRYWEEEREIRAAEAEADDLPRVKLETTAGDITLELFEDHAPNTVANFVHLIETGFYDGTIFHRVIPNFMAQGGDPTGTGRGGPGWSIRDELGEDYRRHFRGSLSMAHAGPDTGGSQFFLTFLPTPHLDGKHTVFGRVIEGMDVLAKLNRRNPGDDVPADEILQATVERKRDHDYTPEKLPARR